MENISETESFYDRLQSLLHTDPAMMPYGHTLGYTVEHVAEGEVTVAMPSDHKLHNMFGYTHGGAIFSITDTAMGLAHVSLLKPGETATTVEAKINYLRPALSGVLRAHARCVKYGRTLSYFECDVTDEEGRLLAKCSATMMTLRDERSQGRNQMYSAPQG